MRKQHTNQRSDLYGRITDKIIAELEQGVRPWIQPWNTAHASDRITRPLRHNGQPIPASTPCRSGRLPAAWRRPG
ncbi:hypothetical protein thsrh120_52810 [Rhizobium sp. No.120]